MIEAVTVSIRLWDRPQLFILCVCLCVFGNACILVTDLAPAVFYVIGDFQLYCIYLSLS